MINRILMQMFINHIDFIRKFGKLLILMKIPSKVSKDSSKNGLHFDSKTKTSI